MIDIVDWLRKEAELVALPRLAEAAAEIERLRERNNVLESAHQQTRKTLDNAYVEIGELRAALALQETAVSEYQQLIIELRVANERLGGESAGLFALPRPRASP